MSRLRYWALGLAGLGLAAELSARALGFGTPLLYRASASGYELVPDQTVRRLGKVTHVNAQGLRGPDLTPSVPAGVSRILILGDSVANGGTQINDSETIAAHLQDDLGHSGIHAQVTTAAAGGWAVPNEAVWLATHGTQSARLVVLEINEKDLEQPFVDASLLDHNVSFPSHAPISGLQEIVMRYALPRLGLLDPGADPGSTSGAHGNAASAAAMLEAVSQIDREVTGKGGRLIVLYWDIRMPQTPAVPAQRAALFQRLATLNVPVIRPELNRINPPTGFRDDMHPNAVGNLAIAHALTPAVLAALAPDRDATGTNTGSTGTH